MIKNLFFRGVGESNNKVMIKDDEISLHSCIATLVGLEFSNDAIFAALQHRYPYVIRNDALRVDICLRNGIVDTGFDNKKRNQVLSMISNIRSKMKENNELKDIVKGNSMQILKPSDVKMVNIERLDSGIDGINYVYGRTIERYLNDSVDSVYDESGEWVGGSYRRGDMVSKDGSGLAAMNVNQAKISHGMPRSFLSVWGGSPGVGKTRLAISVCKGLNRYANKCLYFNGEASNEDFRLWLGNDISDDYFQFITNDLISMGDVLRFIKQEKPSVVVIDSLQMLVESHNGRNAINSILNQFKSIKNDMEYGCPHIILISQLTKGGELYGSNLIRHLVDFVGKVRHIKDDDREGDSEFVFECVDKNRAGSTPRSVVFEHGESGVIYKRAL